MTENDILNILNESEDDSGDDAGDFEDFSSDDTIKFKIKITWYYILSILRVQ